VFVALHTGEVANDHYPQYEFLFASPNATTPPTLLSENHHFVDFAGVEGMEWPVLFTGGGPLPAPAAIRTRGGSARGSRLVAREEDLELQPHHHPKERRLGVSLRLGALGSSLAGRAIGLVRAQLVECPTSFSTKSRPLGRLGG
jgi:hypothetical protein